MQSKEKNNSIQKIGINILIISLCLTVACNTKEENGKEMSSIERLILDSLSKVSQKRRVDSMKHSNPLLILPPDSVYTGSYVDKYESGINKFVGFYRQGKRHGQWLSFFPSGLAWSEMHYEKGLRQGPNLVYHTSGKLRYSGFYKNDCQDSIWTYYDTLGKAEKKVLFKMNRVIREMELKK